MTVVGGPAVTRTGSGTLQFSVENNTGGNPRVAYGAVAGQPIAVVQGGLSLGECVYDVVAPAGIDFPTEGGVLTVTVTPQSPSCLWTVSRDRADWLSVPDLGIRQGALTFQVTAPYNQNVSARTGYLTIGGRTEYALHQAVPAEGNTFNVSVIAPNGCGWEAVALDPFIEITENAQGSSAQQFRVSVQNNPNAAPRQGFVQVTHGKLAPAMLLIDQDGLVDGIVDPGGTPEYYHEDALGSVRLITNAAGVEVRRYDYWPFGQEVASAQPAHSNAVLFTGKERDTETKFGGWDALDYFGARYYSSQTGRFTSVDPVLRAPDAVLNPQRWNRYSYSLNNPLRYTDPDGRYVVGCSESPSECQERARRFEQERKGLLAFGDGDQKVAARAFGDPGEANGVTVVLSGFSGDGQTYRARGTGEISVYLGPTLFGADLARVVAHEGTHVIHHQNLLRGGWGCPTDC